MALPQLMDDTVEFVPDNSNSRILRNAFGRFATGVTIITAQSDEGPVAITANSFSSVSLTPPLVLWSADRSSRRYPYFRAAEKYAIHILAAEQDELCWRIVKDQFGLNPNEWFTNVDGVPLLNDCLARFECTRRAFFDGGDHDIILGEVQRVQMRETGDALGFFKGKMFPVADA